MAVFSKIVIAAAGLAGLVTARPLAMDKRLVTSMVTETTWSTVDVVATVWVNDQGVPVSTDVPAAAAAQVQTTSPVNPVASTPTTTSSAAPVVQQSQAPPVETTTMTTSTPPPATTPVTTPAAFYTTSTASVAATSAAPVATSSASTSNSPASGGSTGASGISASASNSCEGEGAACQGDITHWDGGLGACGWNVNTASDMEIALPYEFMGTQSNGNPYCGRSLTIMNPNTGATVQATVGDKCMGCTGRSIDLTDALFNAIGDGCNGRCSGFDWWFN